jgi:hypothetical protein
VPKPRLPVFQRLQPVALPSAGVARRHHLERVRRGLLAVHAQAQAGAVEEAALASSQAVRTELSKA